MVSDIDGVVAVTLLSAPLIFAWVLWLLPQYDLPRLIVLSAAFLVVAVFAPLIKMLWTRRHLIVPGLRRIVGGPAVVRINATGVEVRRRRWTTQCNWQDISSVQQYQDRGNGEPDEFYFDCVLRNRDKVSIDDNSTWAVFDRLNRMSSHTLEARLTGPAVVDDRSGDDPLKVVPHGQR